MQPQQLLGVDQNIADEVAASLGLTPDAIVCPFRYRHRETVTNLAIRLTGSAQPYALFVELGRVLSGDALQRELAHQLAARATTHVYMQLNETYRYVVFPATHLI
jgi:hypothetical protein